MCDVNGRVSTKGSAFDVRALARRRTEPAGIPQEARLVKEGHRAGPTRWSGDSSEDHDTTYRMRRPIPMLLRYASADGEARDREFALSKALQAHDALAYGRTSPIRSRRIG